MILTQNFQNYLRAFNIRESKRLIIDDIKESDGVYPGDEIFSFFLNGSRCNLLRLLIR